MIRVLVVDDHALVRSGLRLLLDADPEITVEDETEAQESRAGCAFVHLANQPDWAEAFLLSLGGASTSSAPCSATATLRRGGGEDQEPFA